MRFPDMIWLMLRGDLPSRGQSELLEAAMVPGVDHGPQAPSIAIARMAVTCGLPVNGAMASAINVLDDIHGGAGQQCMELYREIDAEAGNDGDLVVAATTVIERHRDAGEKIVPGFGHRFHPVDPRTAPLFALVAKAQAAGIVSGRFAAIGHAVEDAISAIEETPHSDEHRRHHRRHLLRAGLRAGARPRPVRAVARGRHPCARVGAEATWPPDHGTDADGNSVSLQRAGAPRRAPRHRQHRGHRLRHELSAAAPSRTPGLEDEAMKDLISNQLVKYLEARGVEHIFGLCGHTNIAVLAALAKSTIKFVNTRHEQIAAHAADGYARATKRTSVVLTHLSPGLTNAATGVANAALDSIPMVVIAGDVPSHYYGKHPHQEVNLHADASQHEIYRPFVKRAWRVDSAHLFPEIIEKAFALAESGRPGPVLVDVPMDIFSKEIDVALFERLRHNAKKLQKPSLDEETAATIVQKLVAAKRPVLYVGGGILLADAAAELRTFVDHLRIPVAHTLMGKGALPDDHPFVLGMTGFWGTKFINDQCRGADVILAPGHALLRSRLQLVGARVHVQHSSDPADPDRHRSCRDRAQLSGRDRRRRRSPAGTRSC